VSAGAIDALVGAVVGAALAFALGWLTDLLRDRKQVRRVARLISGELLENQATADLVLNHGPGWMPVAPRTAQWDVHAGELVGGVDEDTLSKVEYAYSLVRVLENISNGSGGDGDWSEIVGVIRTGITGAIDALAPFRK
jgi:hypothetical protein